MAKEYNKRTALAAETVTAVAEALGGLGLECHVNVLNKSATPRKVSLYIGTSTTPTAADYLEFETVVRKGTPLIRGPFVLASGDKIYAKADGADVNVVAMGKKAWMADE